MIDLRKNLIERRMIELSPDLAKHYLTFNTYETQREVRPLYVWELANKMEKNLFRFGEVGFAVMNGLKDIMINGQHVCNAVIESGITVPCILERFKVANNLELSEAFRQFEILPRSMKDMIKVEHCALKLKWPQYVSLLLVAIATIEKAELRKLGSPVDVHFKNIATPTKKFWLTKEDKIKLLKNYLKEGDFLANILTSNYQNTSGNHSKFLRKKAVGLIMIKSWKIDQSDAYKFWERIRDGENLKRDMPEMKLREFLLQTRASVRRSVYAARSVTDHEYAYRCALAWNAFRSGKPTNLAYHPDNPIPKLK
ncbi:MAG: hypothetical protein PHO01_12710 [Desulfotomaculaceae bacterium]|nr:hypothetical protein [Desulfotomaculaceae bacterium]